MANNYDHLRCDLCPVARLVMEDYCASGGQVVPVDQCLLPTLASSPRG